MPTCTVNKVLQTEDWENKHLFQILSCLESIGIKISVNGPWVAGGSVVKTILDIPLEESDIDIFFPSLRELNRCKRILEAQSKPVRQSKFSETFEFPFEINGREENRRVQTIYEVAPDIENIITKFDLNICRVAFDGENICWIENSLVAIQNKKMEIIYDNITYPVLTFLRIIKYVKRGFDIDSSNLLAFSKKYIKPYDDGTLTY